MKIKRFALGQLWTNCYVVWDSGNDGIIVDPGGPAKNVETFVRDNAIKVHWILLTHGHSDHIGGVAEVRNLSENGVAVHIEDADCLTASGRNLSGMWGETFETGPADKILKDKDKIQVGTMAIDVIHTPGHTQGGVCYFIKDDSDQVLLSGDTLFARSIGRSDLPGGDEEELLESLKKLDAFPDELKVFPGHGPETTIGEERRYNPYWPR